MQAVLRHPYIAMSATINGSISGSRLINDVILLFILFLRACFKSSDLSLRSRRQRKAWGVSPRSTVVEATKPTEWATARKAAARFTGLMELQT